jgi:hypothetical protein
MRHWRELLAVPTSLWSMADRQRYRQMITAEFKHVHLWGDFEADVTETERHPGGASEGRRFTQRPRGSLGLQFVKEICCRHGRNCISVTSPRL